MSDSRLTPGLIVLDKGLNLQTPKLTAPGGSVLNTLNYEQVDFQGQKRIDGFVRYDGSRLSDLLDYTVIVYTGTGTTFDTADVGDVLVGDDGIYGILVGKDVGYGSDLAAAVAVIAPINAPAVGVSAAYGATIVSVNASAAYETTPATQYARLLAYNTILRDKVESLPGPIAGLHWFKDRLYAVAGVTAVSLSDTTPVIYPNDVLVLGGTTATVLDAYVLDNTRLLFISAMDPAPWQVEGAAVTRSAVSVGAVANGYEDLTTEIASFFESRSEAQVLDEDGPSGPYDFGWRFNHLGWAVSFEDGISLFGSLPSLNQNIKGVGIQGPTSTTGDAGRPLALKQNVAITGYQAQVSGWKSSNTPSTFELDPDNLTDVDSLYIYADAFVQWTSGSSVVSAPGITSAALTQYPADATVEVEI